MANEEKCLNLTGEEMVALATSFSLCIAKKMTPKELCLMRTFFQAVASNLSTIEFTDTVCKNRN